MLNSEEIKPVALAIIELCLSKVLFIESKSVGWLVGWLVCRLVGRSASQSVGGRNQMVQLSTVTPMVQV